MNVVATTFMQEDKSINVEETKRKLHFLPASTIFGAKRDKLVLKVSVDAKHGRMNVLQDAVAELGFNRGFYKLYYATGSRIIGFKVQSKLSDLETRSKEWKTANINKISGHAIIGVKTILNQMIGLEPKTYKGLEIKKYKDEAHGMLGDDAWIYYVELK